ncbi:MAG: hypothetical protein IKN39_03980 [Clostridia bacterium]|nr:hypothetical protein [Clostridia bacterium]
MKIAKPELKVVRFASEDVIATSIFAVLQNDGSYNVYSGAIDSVVPETDGWHVNMDTTTTLYNWSEEKFNEEKNKLGYDVMYLAYLGTYNDSQYYTNGAPFEVQFEAGGQGGTGGPTPGSGPAIPGFPGFGN